MNSTSPKDYSAAVRPCACCRAPGPLPFVDSDLAGPVCHDCRQKLRAAAAWLKCVGLRACAQAHGTQTRLQGGAA